MIESGEPLGDGSALAGQPSFEGHQGLGDFPDASAGDWLEQVIEEN
jgi:hypothetical protein